MPKRKRKITRFIGTTIEIVLKNNLFQPKESQPSKPKKGPFMKQPSMNKSIRFEGSLKNK